MAKEEVQISIKIEPELRDQFMAVAAAAHQPAERIMRDLIRAYIAEREIPNAETIAAIAAVERSEYTTHANTEELFKTLGI
ncbi:MAG: addiction module antitoxin [Candidatus Methylumidiphilus sp.]